MTTIPITLTDSEQAAYREGRLTTLVRPAEVCEYCHGTGSDNPVEEWPPPCTDCDGTGYKNPLGQKGDVLFHQEEWMVSARDDYTDAVEIEIGLASPDQQHWVMFGDDNTPFVPELCTIQPADSMPFWASRPSLRITRTDEPRFVRLWDLSDDEIIAWAATDWTWPENVDSDGNPYTRDQRLEWDRETCEERWDANNPDAPWSSNPVVVVGGVK